MRQFSLAILIAGFAGSAFAQQPSEMQQRFACMGDALRLCSQFVPDREKIRLCMAAQHDALSAGCKPVFDASMRALEAQRRGGR